MTFRLLALSGIVLLLILGPFFLFGPEIEVWARRVFHDGRQAGPGAQLLLVLLLASDVLLPVPSSLVSAAGGALWGFGQGTVLSAVGMTIGSCLGYGLGRWAGTARVRAWLGDEAKLRVLFHRYGDWIVVLLRPVPVLAEASSMFAGLSRMSWIRFIGMSCVANAIVSAFYTGAGVVIAARSEVAGLVLLIAVLAVLVLTLKAARFRTDGGLEARAGERS